ncbi:MAG: hypothetical protein CM15mP85_04970 [Rhodobacterales bacterium]|nr:MAG: hypothetical protein CM15mP85_04970 [Rhodobacterales bacterium]
MNLKFIIQTLILLILLSLSVVRVSASELINGKIIKQQAQEFFNELNLGLQLVVSDKRTFFFAPHRWNSARETKIIGLLSWLSAQRKLVNLSSFTAK